MGWQISVSLDKESMDKWLRVGNLVLSYQGLKIINWLEIELDIVNGLGVEVVKVLMGQVVKGYGQVKGQG